MNMIYIAFRAYSELALAIYNNIHWYREDFVTFLIITLMIPVNFIRNCWTFYFNHYNHLCYLAEIGFADHSELVDSGNFVVKLMTRGYEGNKSGNSKHLPISAQAMANAWTSLSGVVDLTKTTFIDFGCGTGFPLLSAMTQPLEAIVGVDLHQASTEFAAANVRAFRGNAKVKCANVAVIHADMLDYSFAPCTNMVLFMYEPLWSVPFAKANDIYKTVLLAAKAACSESLTVVYCFVGHYDGNAIAALESGEVGGVLLSFQPYASLHFGVRNNMFLYSIPVALATHDEPFATTPEPQSHDA